MLTISCAWYYAAKLKVTKNVTLNWICSEDNMNWIHPGRSLIYNPCPLIFHSVVTTEDFYIKEKNLPHFARPHADMLLQIFWKIGMFMLVLSTNKISQMYGRFFYALIFRFSIKCTSIKSRQHLDRTREQYYMYEAGKFSYKFTGNQKSIKFI